MKSIILTLFIIPFFLGTTISEPNPKSDTVVVLELFTSQGCSSCPPADKYLNEVKSDRVIALSYHVDYWNYIGWEDPFSKASYSNKQRRYGVKFNSSTIYTPQVVVNGREHFVGSKKSVLYNKIEEYSKKEAKGKVYISNVSKSESLIGFNYGFEGNIKDKTIRTVLVINERTTSVKRGENRNRELVNSNIVVNEQQFQLDSKEGKGSIIIPEIVKDSDKLSLILIIEDSKMNIETAALEVL